MLNAIGANVYCEARKNEDLAWIKTYGYNVVKLSNLNENLKNKDIIINTIPSIILNEEKLKLLDKNKMHFFSICADNKMSPVSADG